MADETPNGYERALESSREILWVKEHGDGRQTQVHVEGRQKPYRVTAVDIRGDRELSDWTIGREDSPEAAKALAAEWMDHHPNGVRTWLENS